MDESGSSDQGRTSAWPELLRGRAEALGLPAGWWQAVVDDDAFQAWERGRASLDVSRFEALCRVVALDPPAVYAGAASGTVRGSARLRSVSGVLDSADLRVVAVASEMSRVLGALYDELNGRMPALAERRAPRPLDGRRPPHEEGYDLGEAAHRWAHPQPGPLADLPGWLLGQGVHVGRVEFASRGVDAVSVWESRGLPIVLVNARSRRARTVGAFRAALAHELAHLLHDGDERDLSVLRVSGRLASPREDEVEQRARAFAPAFLAPPPEVRRWSRRWRETTGRVPERDADRFVRDLARHWGLSREGAAWHAKSCRVLPVGIAEELAVRPGRGVRLARNFAGPRALEERWERLSRSVSEPLRRACAAPWRGLACRVLAEAQQRGLVSMGRAVELARWA